MPAAMPSLSYWSPLAKLLDGLDGIDSSAECSALILLVD